MGYQKCLVVPDLQVICQPLENQIILIYLSLSAVAATCRLLIAQIISFILAGEMFELGRINNPFLTSFISKIDVLTRNLMGDLN